ncbi:MAG TPA: SRPBCC family protein [Propionibacteriaceae bacterium]|nr:SRPBCC family protein [Propionibacteriaceae bacterium]
MTTQVQKTILVNVPVSTAYNQWTQFEEFPHFMGGVKQVTHLSDDRLQWVAEIAGVKRQWEARILEQVPDRKVAWAATEGATNAGSVTFEDLGGSQTSVSLFLEYEPEGLVEKVGDKLNIVENQAEKDLERFKSFIEDEGYASGAWRGTVSGVGHVGTPGVEHADESRGDSGKAGISGKAVAAGLGAAAVAAAGVAAATANKGSSSPETVTPIESAPVTPVESVSTTTETGSDLGSPVGGQNTSGELPKVFSSEDLESGEAGPYTGTVEPGSEGGDLPRDTGR